MSQCEILWWGIFELDIRGGLWAEPWIQINKVSFPAWICVRVRLFRGRAEDGRVGAINHTFCCRLRSEWMRRKTKHRKATSGVWVKNVVRSRLFIRGAEPRARLMLGWAFRNSSTTLLSRETTAKISRNQEEATQLEFAQWRNTRCDRVWFLCCRVCGAEIWEELYWILCNNLPIIFGSSLWMLVLG